MRTATTGDREPRVLARPEHTLSRKGVSAGALKVLYRLHRSGYLAFLVGGGVRDLLLGRKPKDFDIVTNARPEEIRRLFRNSRIIGRRFRLVHVLFRGEVIEVATFRASPEAEEGPDDWEEAAATEAEENAEDEVGPRRRGLPPLDESVFGSPAEDARRRDFTVNALFYDIADFSIIDYVGGIDDLERRVIRTIGEPVARFEEDPVRMMRALEYGVRLEFAIDPDARSAIDRCVERIHDASAARLTYELQEGLRSGSAAGICAAWEAAGLFNRSFPDLPTPGKDVRPLLEILDRWADRDHPMADATVLGPFFLPDATREIERLWCDGRRFDNPSYLGILGDLLTPPTASMHLSNHAFHLLHHGLFTLSKFRRAPDRARLVLKLTRQDYFPVAWDLYSLAVEGGLLPEEPYQAWRVALRRLERGEAPTDRDDGNEGRPTRTRRRRRRRPRRRTSE